MKRAGSVTCATVAVAVKRPLVAFARKPGEVATPSALVVSVAWLVPSSKLAPAAAPEPPPRSGVAGDAEAERHGRADDGVAVGVEHAHRERLRGSGG